MHAWKEVDEALFTEAFNSIEHEGDKLKLEMAPLFKEELLNFHMLSSSHTMIWRKELKKTRWHSRPMRRLFASLRITRFGLFSVLDFMSRCGLWRSYCPPSMMPSKT